jgi:hypothetical protein
LVGIEKVALKSIFHNWMERLCIKQARAGYYPRESTRIWLRSGQGPVPSGGGRGICRLRTRTHHTSINQRRNQGRTEEDAACKPTPEEWHQIAAVLLLRVEWPSGSGRCRTGRPD